MKFKQIFKKIQPLLKKWDLIGLVITLVIAIVGINLVNSNYDKEISKQQKVAKLVNKAS